MSNGLECFASCTHGNFKWYAEHTMPMLAPFTGKRGSATQTSATTLVQAAQKLYKHLQRASCAHSWRYYTLAVCKWLNTIGKEAGVGSTILVEESSWHAGC